MAGIEKLIGRLNYRVWTLQMKRLLQARDLWDIVGPLPQLEQVPKPKPEKTPGTNKKAAPLGETPATTPALAPPTPDFVIRDANASCLIMEHCASGVLDLIAATECARSQWALLRDLYKPSSAQLHRMRQTFLSLAEYSDSKRFAQIGAELRSLQAEIEDYGGNQPSDEEGLMVLEKVARGRGLHNTAVIVDMRGCWEFEAVLARLVRYEWAVDGWGREPEGFMAMAALSLGGRGRGGGRGGQQWN